MGKNAAITTWEMPSWYEHGVSHLPMGTGHKRCVGIESTSRFDRGSSSQRVLICSSLSAGFRTNTRAEDHRDCGGIHNDERRWCSPSAAFLCHSYVLGGGRNIRSGSRSAIPTDALVTPSLTAPHGGRSQSAGAQAMAHLAIRKQSQKMDCTPSEAGLFPFLSEHDILPGMGFTKKQRREQKKQHSLPINYKKQRRKPMRPPGEPPARAPRPQQMMVLAKISWAEAQGDPQEQFQLLKLAAGKHVEQLRQEVVDHFHSQGKENCTVELFDPDNVPPGTIPDQARILPG